MNLTDYTDILDDLEAKGSVPAGFWRGPPLAGTNPSGWRFDRGGIVFIERLEGDRVDMALAMLCDTMTEALRSSLRMYWIFDRHGPLWKVALGSERSFYCHSRIDALAAAYRAHCELAAPPSLANGPHDHDHLEGQ